MFSVVEELRLELPPRPESVTTARHAAVDLARSAGVDVADVQIAVSEAVGNAVLHAYPDGEPREDATVRVTGARFDDKLQFVVQDDGVGIRPNPDSPGLKLGLPLIGQVCEDLHVDTRTGGTRVTMTFDAGAD